jgi:hypothetical protein
MDVFYVREIIKNSHFDKLILSKELGIERSVYNVACITALTL